MLTCAQFGHFHNWESIKQADSRIMRVRDFKAPLVKAAASACFTQANQKSNAHMKSLGVVDGVQQVRKLASIWPSCL